MIKNKLQANESCGSIKKTTNITIINRIVENRYYIPSLWTEIEEKRTPWSTGRSIGECRNFLYKESIILPLILAMRGNRYYFLNPSEGSETEEKHTPSSTGRSVSKCQNFLYKKTINTTMTTIDKRNRYYILITSRWPMNEEKRDSSSNCWSMDAESFLLRKLFILPLTLLYDVEIFSRLLVFLNWKQ